MGPDERGLFPLNSFRTRFQFDGIGFFIKRSERPGKFLFTVQRRIELNIHDLADIAFKVLIRFKRTVYAEGAYREVIRLFDRVGCIEHGIDGIADQFAVIKGNAVRMIYVQSQHPIIEFLLVLDFIQLIPERSNRRFDDIKYFISKFQTQPPEDYYQN